MFTDSPRRLPSKATSSTANKPSSGLTCTESPFRLSPRDEVNGVASLSGAGAEGWAGDGVRATSAKGLEVFLCNPLRLTWTSEEGEGAAGRDGEALASEPGDRAKLRENGVGDGYAEPVVPEGVMPGESQLVSIAISAVCRSFTVASMSANKLLARC